MKTFQDEKDFYKQNSHPNGSGWDFLTEQKFDYRPRFDPDIYPFLVLMNSFDFMYSAGMSCSGSIKDHDGVLIAHNYRFGTNTQTPQGYCVIRAETSSNMWQEVEGILTRVPHSQLVASVDWEREVCRCHAEFPISKSRNLFAYQIFTGDNKVRGDEIARIWKKLTYELVDLIQGINRVDF